MSPRWLPTVEYNKEYNERGCNTNFSPDRSAALIRASVQVIVKQQANVCYCEVFVRFQACFQALQPSKHQQQMPLVTNYVIHLIEGMQICKG